MKISRIEHLGIAVQSIDEVLPFFQDVLGLEVYKTEVVEDQKDYMKNKLHFSDNEVQEHLKKWRDIVDKFESLKK